MFLSFISILITLYVYVSVKNNLQKYLFRINTKKKKSWHKTDLLLYVLLGEYY